MAAFRATRAEGRFRHGSQSSTSAQTTEEVSQILRLANNHGIHIVIFGAGTNVTGAAAPQSGECVVLDMEKMNRIEVQPNDLTVTVQSGVMLKDLEAGLNHDGYTLRHFPQWYNLASIGGLIATNSIGQVQHKVRRHREHGLESRGCSSRRDDSVAKEWCNDSEEQRGTDLEFLIEGSEGMFGVVTRAVLRILPVPEHTWVHAFRFSNFEEEGLHALKELMLADLIPVGCAAVRWCGI